MLTRNEIYQSVIERFWRLGEDRSTRAGTGPLTVGLPENVVVIRRHREDDPGNSARNRYHPRYVLLINLETPGTVILDHRRHRFEPRQFMLISPYQVHI